MAGATINLSQSSSSGTYIDSKIVWSSTPDNDANDSDVTAKIYVRKDNDDVTLTIDTTGTWSWSVTINGTKKSGTLYASVLTDWVLLATVKVSGIDHDSDGSKSITIKGSVSGPSGTSLSGHTTSGSGTAVLDTIPRASTLDSLSCATKYFTGTLTYKYTPQSSSYYNRCNISLNLDGTYIAVKSILIGKKSAAQQTETVTLSADELETIYNELPKTTKGILRFTLRTYSDSDYSTQVGDAVAREVTLYIPSNTSTRPSLSIALEPVSSLGEAFEGLYIQTKTKVKATLTASTKYGASITARSMYVDGKSYDSSDDFTSGYLANAGSITVSGTVEDSRGFSTGVGETITVISYSKPKILPATGEGGETEIICDRCDVDGNLTDSGTYLKIKAKRSYSKVKSGGVQYNKCAIRYRYRLESDTTFSAWRDILDYDTLDIDMVDCVVGGSFDTQKTYVVQLGVIDYIGHTASTVVTIPTAEVYDHRPAGGRRRGFGKYCEEDDLFDIAWNTRVRGELRLGDDGNAVADFVVEEGTFVVTPDDSAVVEGEGAANKWFYRKYNSGHYVMFGNFSVVATESNETGSLFYSNAFPIKAPFQIASAYVAGNALSYCWLTSGGVSSEQEDSITFRLMRGTALSTSSAVSVRLVVHGLWK